MSIVATLYPRRRRRKSRHGYVRRLSPLIDRSIINTVVSLLAWSDAYVLAYLYLSQAPQTEQKWMAAVSYLKPSCGEKLIKKRELTWKVEALYLYVSSRPSLEE